MAASAFRACPCLGKTVAAGLLLFAFGAVALAEETMVDGSNPPPAGLSGSPRIGAPADRPGRAIAGPGKENPPPSAECRPLVIRSAPQLPQGMLQQPYRFRLQVSGAATPVTFSLPQRDHLPPGLNLDPRGLITGVPREPGAFVFVVAAADRCRQFPRRTQQRFMVSIGTAQRLPLGMDAPAVPHRAVTAPPGVGDLRITRLSLAFEEAKAAPIVVGRNQKVPTVVARLQARGSGVVAGYWVTPGKGRFFF